MLLWQEYELDGVDMKTVNFEDNQDCLDLFEKVICFPNRSMSSYTSIKKIMVLWGFSLINNF